MIQIKMPIIIVWVSLDFSECEWWFFIYKIFVSKNEFKKLLVRAMMKTLIKILLKKILEQISKSEFQVQFSHSTNQRGGFEWEKCLK